MTRERNEANAILRATREGRVRGARERTRERKRKNTKTFATTIRYLRPHYNIRERPLLIKIVGLSNECQVTTTGYRYTSPLRSWQQIFDGNGMRQFISNMEYLVFMGEIARGLCSANRGRLTWWSMMKFELNTGRAVL